MKKQPNDPVADTVAYTLREIPRPLWKKAQIRAIENDLDMRALLLGLLRSYVAGKSEPKNE